MKEIYEYEHGLPEYLQHDLDMYKDGLSIRKISKELCIPSATIARYIKASYQNNYEKK